MTESEQPILALDEAEKLVEIHKIGYEVPAPPANLPEPTLSENAMYIAKTRYARRDLDGNPTETPKELFWRVAYNIATAERIYGAKKKEHIAVATKFYKLLANKRFIPGTPTLLNAAKPKQQLSSCFVLPIDDSLDSILQTATDMAKIHKSGGGTGFSFSRLRPKNDILKSSGGTTTGPISFMQMFNDMTSAIRQGGMRRGANMGILHYNHPDILTFIIYKLDEFSLTNFNISVTTDKDFFDQIKIDQKILDDDYESGLNFDEIIDEAREALQTRDIDLKQLRLDAVTNKLHDWCKEDTPGYGYPLINPRTNQEVARLNAKKVFDLITRFAWHYGDPGMIFLDLINNSRANPVPRMGQIEATNPCGEQPILPYDACNLGAINLAVLIKDKQMDWDTFRTTIHESVNFLDDVLDMNEYPLEKIRQTVKQIRRIGLGIMGFADALLAMEIGYNTNEGVEMAEKIMRFIRDEADNASCELAKNRGVFPGFEGSIYDKPGEIQPRNGARTTIAPTGTTSMLADASSGCEPLFAITFAKNTLEGKRMFQTSPYFLKTLQERGLYSEDLLEKIQDNGGSIQNIDEIPADLKKVFVVAGDITPEWHLKIQAAFQKYVDSAISKTINFPNSAEIEDVRKAYIMAYETGCRGITIYRDGSREKQVLETKKDSSYYDKLAGKKEEKVSDENQNAELPLEMPIDLKPRPSVLHGRTYRVVTPLGKAFVTINEDDSGDIFEVFINVGRAGSDITADAEAIGRLISLTFRIPTAYTSDQIAQKVISKLRGIGGSSSTGFGAERVRSLADAVAKAIDQHQTAKILKESNEDIIEAQETVSFWDDDDNLNTPSDLCPECGSASLRFIEGCQKCELCGFSKC